MRVLMNLDNGAVVAVLDSTDLAVFGPGPYLTGIDYRSDVAQAIAAAKGSVQALLVKAAEVQAVEQAG